MSEHKSCPYCGETEMLKAVVSQARPGVQSGFIECDNCGARGQTQYGSCDPDDMLDLVWSGWDERVDAAPSPVQRVEELEKQVRYWKAKYDKVNSDWGRFSESRKPNMYWNVDSPEEPTDPSDAATEMADEYGAGFYVLEMSSAWQGPDYFFVVEATADPDNKNAFETKLTEYPSRDAAADVVRRALLSDSKEG